ncbi:MAG: ATP-binding protein [Alphaproteobacteria bacterium]|nr:ATP-binding protein [Alphaproteobacteria bacterium]
MIGGRAANGDFQVMVRDNGPGIPRDKLDMIFTPFNQVDNRFDRQAAQVLAWRWCADWLNWMAAAPGGKANLAGAARCS